MTTSAKFNILNALTLIVIGGMGYFATESLTALIPPAFGVILLGCHWGVEKQNKIIAHIAVLITLIILVALIGKRLPKSIDAGGPGLIRVLAMITTSALSMVFFIRSFIEARRNRESQGN